MSRKDGAVQKAIGNPMGNVTSGNDHQHTAAAGNASKPAKGSPSSARVPKPPPPPPIGPSSRKLSKAPKEAISKATDSQISKVATLKGLSSESSKDARGPEVPRKSKETLAERTRASNGERRNQPTNSHKPLETSSAELMANVEAWKQSEPCQKPKEIPLKAVTGRGASKVSSPLGKSKETQVKSAVGVKTQAVLHDNTLTPKPRKPRETASKASTNQKGVGFEPSPPKGLCKECKLTSQESVCFIANDGRVAACSTGSSIVHLHYCNSPRCAANPNYRQPSAPPKKYLVSKRRLLKSQTASENKPSTLSLLGDPNGGSSCHSSLHGDGNAGSEDGQSCSDDGRELRVNGSLMLVAEHNGNRSSCDSSSHKDESPSVESTWFEHEQSYGGEIRANGSTPVADQNGSESCGYSSHGDDLPPLYMRELEDKNGAESCGYSSHGDDLPPILMRELEDKQSCRDGGGEHESNCSTPVADENGASSCKSSFHGDERDEQSCSDDDGREFTTVDGTSPNIASSVESKSNGQAVSGINNNDVMDSGNKLQRKRSGMSRMRRNYLNFLKEQEAETVRLRKQMIQERKQAGEWMLDCAIEEVLHKLAPNGETRVKVLVEAFETVMSHSDSETQAAGQHHEHHHHNTSLAMHC